MTSGEVQQAEASFLRAKKRATASNAKPRDVKAHKKSAADFAALRTAWKLQREGSERQISPGNDTYREG